MPLAGFTVHGYHADVSANMVRQSRTLIQNASTVSATLPTSICASRPLHLLLSLQVANAYANCLFHQFINELP